MPAEHEELMYEGVRRMVTWDEPRADVFHRLEVNGIVGAKAEEMYAKARAERVAAIRKEGLRAALTGLVLLSSGVGVFAAFLFGMQGMNRMISILCTTAAILGGWRFFKGLFGFLFASSKEGSLADEE